MNGLTLRISSNKKIHPIKKDRQKEDIQQLLPANYDSKIFEKLLSANSVEEQVHCLKEVFKEISKTGTGSEASFAVIDVIVYIFLYLKPKSILLPPLLKFFSSIPEHFHEYIQNCLTEKLVHQLQDENLSPKNVNEYLMTLLLCLESKNFPYLSLEPCHNEIIKFLIKHLQICHKNLVNEDTPVKKLEIINAIHSSVQVGITITQKNKISLQIELCRVALDLLRDSDLPIDTRSLSGLLAAHLAVEIGQAYWIEIFENILSMHNDLGTLSFCSGLLNILSPKALEVVVTVNCHSENALYIIYKTIIDIEDRNASDNGVVLVATRCMVLLLRSLTSLSHMLVPKMVNDLLSYIWNHIEHYMDSVRHLSLSALSYMQSIAKSHPDLGIFEKITNDLENMHIEKRSKHAAISVLISYIPVSNIISQSPGLIKTLLASALANPPSNYALNSLENLMKQDFKEQPDKDKWFELWVSPLLSCDLSAPLELLLTTLLRIHPSIIEHIVSLGLNENNQNIAVVLTCLKIGRKLNILKGIDDTNKWKGLIDICILEKCMYHAEDNIRLSCFALLIETSKTTEEFSPIELHLAELFLTYNFSTQEPAVRQNALAYCKKFLTRLRDSRAALKRRQNKFLRSDVTYENITVILDNYSNTIRRVKDMCIDSLFPGSSLFRRSFAFGFLAIYKELGFWTVYDEKSAQVLLLCLLDSYEDNKAISKELLKSLPPHLLKFNDKNHVERYIKEALLLSSSIRPPDSISAAYYMSLLSSFENIIEEEGHVIHNTAYYCASVTLDALVKELETAKESLLQAACSGPLYGQLLVLRYLLKDLDLKEIGTCAIWRELLQRLIETAFECNAVVSHVVYNSSPEGHIPMDFSYTHLKKDSDPQVTSQMVLLCSWRTVKEVSLLLGELSERAPITGDDSACGLLTKQEVLAIGEHLTGLLSETKHRGAFEQAYLGFSKLTSRLWRCYSGELHELPKKWLNETIECISKNENLSATRRSAGIPFIIQALICSELNNGSTRSLHNVMKSLLKIAKEGSSESRVHSLNILRTLYRGSSLGEAVGPYVAEGIATAISGFNSDTWAERNSSTLLLSALMSRVFGVPRGKSETLSWRNRMTGRLFFQRYPNLYEHILSHLEESSKSPMYPALYPVLLLLGRLYPSSLEGTDSNLQLLKYLPFVMSCAESSILKTRSLAATAVSSLIASISCIDYINQLLIEITKTDKENHRHGLLLMILKLIQQASTLEELKSSKLKSDISLWLNTLFDIVISQKYSFISKDTSVQALLVLFLNYCDEISQDQKDLMEKILSRCLFLDSINLSSLEYGSDLFYTHSAILLLVTNIKGRQIDQFIYNTVKLLDYHTYDVGGVTLDLLSFLLGKNSVCFSPNINENLKLTLNPNEISCELIDKIEKSKEIERIILDKLSAEDIHHEQLLKLLDTLQYFPATLKKSIGNHSLLQFLYNICKRSDYSLSSCAIKCLDNFLRFQNCKDFKTSDLESVCEILYDFSSPEADDVCREVTAIMLSTHFHTLIQRASPTSKLYLWTSVFRLLYDEISDIRRIMNKAINDDVVPSKGLENLLDKLIAETDLQLAVVILLSLATGENDDSDKTDDFQESVFDRGSANTYYEDLVFNRHSCNRLLELSKHKDIFSFSFDREYSEWLYDKTGISCTSVLTYINGYKASMESYNTSPCLLPCRPVENSYLLQVYKVQNLQLLLNSK